MSYFIYLISGIIFGLGLAISGMIDPAKVKGFLGMFSGNWNPALLFVLGSAVPVYLISFLFLRKKEKTFNGQSFKHPAPRPIDKKLVIGSLLFGIGWGIAGICPGPALAHIAYLDTGFVVFIASMLTGFELNRRVS